MTDPGLNQRLRQRSRRSGLMIGFSMLLTLVVCVGAFTMIYARLEPVVADFVGRGEIELPTPVPTTEPVAQAPTAVPEATETATAETPPPDDGGDNQVDQVEEDPDAFNPDYQIQADGPVNIRPGPGVSSGPAIVAVPVASPLMFLDEEEPTSDPEGDGMESGQVWMKFRTEDGTEGWIRELDITEYEP